MLSVIGKIYADMLVDRVRSVTGGLIDEEQGSFRAGKGYVDQIFSLIQKDDVGFMCIYFCVCEFYEFQRGI